MYVNTGIESRPICHLTRSVWSEKHHRIHCQTAGRLWGQEEQEYQHRLHHWSVILIHIFCNTNNVNCITITIVILHCAVLRVLKHRILQFLWSVFIISVWFSQTLLYVCSWHGLQQCQGLLRSSAERRDVIRSVHHLHSRRWETTGPGLLRHDHWRRRLDGESRWVARTIQLSLVLT